MLTFDLYNPAALPPARTFLRLLRLAFHRRYSIVFGYHRDTDYAGHARTREATIEVDLYEDGSGLEVAAFGWWLLFGVEAKRGALSAART